MANESGALSMYRDIFREMLRTESTGLIHNDSKDHACVLIEELLNFAKRSVLIFCKNLGRDVWCRDEVLNSLRGALVRHLTVGIVMQDVPDGNEDNEAYKLLVNFGVYPLVTTNTAVQSNFIIIDEKAYRLEKDTMQRKGYACANDPESARILREAYNNLKLSSQSLGDVAANGEHTNGMSAERLNPS